MNAPFVLAGRPDPAGAADPVDPFLGIPLAPGGGGADHGDPRPRARHPPRTVQLTNRRDHAAQPPLSQACVIEVNRDADASNIDTLGSNFLMWIAGGVVSLTATCLVACLTRHALTGGLHYQLSQPGLSKLVHQSLPPWMLAEGAAILDAFLELPSNNSESTLTAATAGGRPYSPGGVSLLIGRVHHRANSGSYLGGVFPK